MGEFAVGEAVPGGPEGLLRPAGRAPAGKIPWRGHGWGVGRFRDGRGWGGRYLDFRASCQTRTPSLRRPTSTWGMVVGKGSDVILSILLVCPTTK